ncbi:fibronectin type III domain-containing protein [Candidatus Uhrbacteria bacterium]|nr:fibronectin type III domain-containing protein [Candidatus Uhrbacteria bacterium]
MSRLLSVLIVIAFIVLGSAWWFSQPRMDSTGKYHVALYDEADGTWDAQMQILPARPQDRLGQTVGSSTMLRMEWQKPEQTYNNFLITYTDPVSGATIKESGEHDRVSLDPSGLAPDTEYVFTIQACFDPRCTSWLVAQDEYRGRTAPEYWSDESEPVLLNP